MRTLLIALMLSGCDGGTLCVDGATDPNGDCIDEGTDPGTETETETETESREPTLADILVDAQPCDGLPPGDRLDIIAGCVDSICAKDSVYEAIQAAGRRPECGPGPAAGWVLCHWPSGIDINVYDTNNNGEADGGETIFWVNVATPFGGSSADGLGLGISPGCYVERFGAPSTTTLYEGDNGKPMLSYGYWPDVGLVMSDREGAPQPYQPDGRVDGLSLYGADGGS